MAAVGKILRVSFEQFLLPRGAGSEARRGLLRSVGWERRAAPAGERVVLASVGVTLDVDALYFNPLADH